MIALFDTLLSPDLLDERDLRALREFGVRAVLSFRGAADTAERRFAEESERLRRAELAGFGVFAPSQELLPGGALEAELQRLPHLLSLPRAVGLGSVGLAPGQTGTAEVFALERTLALAKRLARPVIVQSRPGDGPKEVRRLLAVVRDSGIAPDKVLGIGLPRAALMLARECGHFVGLALSRGLEGKAFVDTVGRFGSERVVVVGNGGDFLSLPKAVSLLEEAKVPPSTIRRVAFENLARLFGVEAL